MINSKICGICNKTFYQRENESNANFKHRKVCNHSCAAKCGWKLGIHQKRYEPKIKLNCLNCGNEFYKSKSSSNRKFCCQYCYGKYRSKIYIKDRHPMWEGGRIKRYCIICGTEFDFDKGDIKRRTGKFEKRFCSIKCKSIWMEDYYKGKNNPNWNNGITPEYIKERTKLIHKNWSKKILKRDNYTCQICGQIGGSLESHHIKSFKNYPKLRINIKNGITLCKKCHRNIHSNKGD